MNYKISMRPSSVRYLLAGSSAISILTFGLVAVLTPVKVNASGPYNGPYGSNVFVMLVDTTKTGITSDTQFQIRDSGDIGFNYKVDCDNDGNYEAIGRTGSYTCNYSTPGIYSVVIDGNFHRVFYNGNAEGRKILEVQQWGSQVWSSFGSAFYGASNIQVTATDAPNLSIVSDMRDMFGNASSLNSNLSSWNVSNVTNMSGMFRGATAYNQPLDSWNVSNVTNMSSMFSGATIFNQPLNSWNTSNVTTMAYMFDSAKAFNQPLNSWNTSNVINMSGMFVIAESFNQALNSWNTSNVTDMQSMFNTARAFNQDIGGWNTSKVTNMNNMLRWTDDFNQDISGWDVSNDTSTYRMLSGSSFNIPIGSWDVTKVSNMQEMFSGAWAFNQPLNNWNVSNVTNMNSMFDGAYSFNQPLNNWNVSKVTNMGNMFNYAFDFNQDISGWDVSKVTTFRWMFRYCDAFNQPIGNWNTSSATNMAGMFEGTPFNQDISSWDVSHVTNMESMFLLSSSFNQDISSWDVSSVANMSRVFEWSVFNQPLDLWDTSSATTMSGMFMYNDDFNQDISSWDTSNVTNMANMFNSANNFDQNISNWDVSKVTDMQNILSYSGLSSENYDALLIEWSSLNLKNNVALGATNITYCNSESQRQYIIDNYSWAIADNGRACGLPVVETGGATNITHNSAVLALNLVSSNSGEIQSLGLQFGEDTNYGYGSYDVSDINEGVQEITKEDLTCETTYHYRAFATTNAGTAFGNDGSFTTDICPPPPDIKLTTILNEPGLIQGQSTSYTFRIDNIGLGDAYPGATLLMMIPNSLEITSLSDDSSYECFEYLEILESPSVAYHADAATPYVCEVYDFELYESDAMLAPGNSFSVTIPFQVAGEVDSSTTMYAFTLGQEETDSEDLYLAFEGTEDIFTLPFNNVANYTGTIPGSSDSEESGLNSDSDPIPDAIEDAAPGNGDGNNDGTPDSAQSNVTSLPLPSGPNAGTYVTLVVPEGSTLTTTAIDQATALATKDSAYDYPLGLMSFTVSSITPGSTIPIELYYYTNQQANNFTPRKYNTTNQTYTTLSTQTQTSLTQTTINNQPVLKLSYQLQDGGPLDQDNTVNGTIVDPVGLAAASVGVPDTGL